jgi:energy-converting hydrogenase Eha subunit H
MTTWIIHQISDFNFFQFGAILFFVVTFQKSNTTKLIDKQTIEIHASVQEIKDVIRWEGK